MISISTCFNYNVPLHKQLKMIKDAKFEYVSISSNYSHNGLLDNPDKLLELIQKYDLKVDTIHGCSANNPEAFKILKDCSEVADRLGAGVVVIHPCDFYITKDKVEPKYKELINLCEKLIPIAKTYNIKYAIENLHPDGATDVLKMALDKLDKKYFGMCYDITHAQIDGPRKCDLIELYGDKIIAVHISDRIKEFVDHVVPGEGFIDFDYMLKKLAEIGYDKPLLMEVLTDHTAYKESEQLLCMTYKSGLKLEQKLEGYR
ncbi:hypothetical protein AN1V17_43250 [Vallitalea sediminicola]